MLDNIKEINVERRKIFLVLQTFIRMRPRLREEMFSSQTEYRAASEDLTKARREALDELHLFERLPLFFDILHSSAQEVKNGKLTIASYGHTWRVQYRSEVSWAMEYRLAVLQFLKSYNEKALERFRLMVTALPTKEGGF